MTNLLKNIKNTCVFQNTQKTKQNSSLFPPPTFFKSLLPERLPLGRGRRGRRGGGLQRVGLEAAVEDEEGFDERQQTIEEGLPGSEESGRDESGGVHVSNEKQGRKKKRKRMRKGKEKKLCCWKRGWENDIGRVKHVLVSWEVRRFKSVDDWTRKASIFMFIFGLFWRLPWSELGIWLRRCVLEPNTMISQKKPQLATSSCS